MGTNFYWTSNPCATCGHSQESLHIGKSSAGWAFAVRVHPDLQINSLDDWKAKLATGGTIKDEYDNIVSVDDMLDRITKRSHHKGLLFGCEEEPSLNRHGRRCWKGEGTYEYCDYEFS